MARDTPLGFPAHTLPYRRGEFTHFIDSLKQTQVLSCVCFLPLIEKIAFTEP